MKLLVGNARETWYKFSPFQLTTCTWQIWDPQSGRRESYPKSWVARVLHSSDPDDATSHDDDSIPRVKSH